MNLTDTPSRLSGAAPGGGGVGLACTGLYKMYGRRPALNDVSLAVHAGDLFGLLGSNGAGKTTFLRIAAGLLPPTSGSLRVDERGGAYSPETIRARIAYMPDRIGIVEQVRVHAYAEFFALLYGIPLRERARRVNAVLAEVGLFGRRAADIRSLSRGMQQRLALARVLLLRPPILLLDEPLSGLDPGGRAEVLGLLRQLSRHGHTVVISSHVLHDLEGFCTRIAILESGWLRFCGPVTEARRAVEPALRRYVAVRDRAAEAAHALADVPGAADVAVDDLRRPPRVYFRLRPPLRDAAPVVTHLVRQGFQLLEVDREPGSLHDIFLHFTEGRVS